MKRFAKAKRFFLLAGIAWRGNLRMEMKEVIQIAPADLDLSGSVKITQMLDWMQRLADTHAHVLGVGRDALRQKNLVWMSARSAVNVVRELGEGESVTLHTWTGENTRAACPRYFAFYDESGACIGGGSTLWMLISTDTRRIISPQKAGVLSDQFSKHIPPVPLPQQLPRVTRVDTTVLRKPVYTDLDINGHVNNVRYVSWVLDAHPLDKLRSHFVSGLQVNYHHEIVPEDNCQIQMECKEKSTLVCGKSQTGERIFFEAVVEFKSRTDKKSQH